MDDLRDCYGLLGLSPGASADEAKRAFRAAVSACHPDRFVNDPVRRRNAEERLRLIIEAYHRIDACRKLGPDMSASAHAGLQSGTWSAGRSPGFPFSSLVTFPNGLFLLLCGVCFLLVVIAGTVTARHDNSLPLPASFEYSDGAPASSVLWPATSHDRPAEPTDGPAADTPLYRQGVRPPHSPDAPVVPLAPAAPAAPLVPPAR